MSDDGYTLAEMLAALTILGLAMGGLGLVVSLIARQQLTANRIQARLVDDRAADQALTRWLVQDGAETLNGDAQGLSFACGAATCAADLEADGRRMRLVLRDRAGAVRRWRLREPGARFTYVGDRGAVVAWPRPADPSSAPSRSGFEPERLRAVLLVAPDQAAPLAVARLWTREPRNCQFDSIIGACRTVTP